MDLTNMTGVMELKPTMITALGMKFHSTPEEDTCVATMAVDERTRHPFGYLSGGASLALAETVAGVGSTALCPDCACVGINVSGNHVKAVPEGDTVTATGRLISRGNKLHVWEVKITDSAGDLVCTATVTNYIIPQR